MVTYDAYQKCPACDKGIYWKNESIGGRVISSPVRCPHCAGKGEILASKLRPKPLYDRLGRPIDQLGRAVQNPQKEPWDRQLRRQKAANNGY